MVNEYRTNDMRLITFLLKHERKPTDVRCNPADEIEMCFNWDGIKDDYEEYKTLLDSVNINNECIEVTNPILVKFFSDNHIKPLSVNVIEDDTKICCIYNGGIKEEALLKQWVKTLNENIV